MRVTNVQKRIAREQRRINRLWADANKLRSQESYGKNGVKYYQLGRFADVWGVATEQGRD